MSHWQTEDPREALCYSKRARIIVNPDGAHLAFAHVAVKESWDVFIDQPGPAWNYPDAVLSDHPWPGWRWVLAPEEAP